ncbi:ABC transporter substrate-binding protein [Candidatus Paracaedibacter symbiosus]|uniref:ABC transporter substrate-binding protein n=1 Tax=Candidatus Paracaedibacter symbiosus TaxID=244582 RepID=UPI0005096A8D|nr:ABC transporter substrate-binding protein [Candidatus Paracaedibacter symbiosus]
MFLKISFAFRILTTLLISTFNVARADSKPVVAITQIAPHPSLDAIRQGILDELKAYNPAIEVVYENAQGNITLAAQIAHKFVSLTPDVIVSIATPSTQTVYNVARKHDIPVVFAAVSDPVAAKLIDATTKTGSGITGVSDFSPVAQQLKLMREIQPSLKKLGVLYSAAEANSVALLNKFEKLATAEGIELVKVTASNTQEVATTAASLHGKVDALYIPNDNTIVSSLESVIKGIGQSVPIYAADPQSVERGCLAAAAFGQYEIGRQTGKVLVRVLKGEKPENIPVETLTKVDITLNQQVADKLGIKFPQTVLNRSVNVFGAVKK